MLNTPPVFSIYVTMLTLQWLKDKGGISAIEKANEQKANLLYNEINRNPLFEAYVPNKDDQSLMNATFNLKNDQLKETFESKMKQAGISGINGHRSIGGYRASMYNALPLESVQVLVEVMQQVEREA